MKKLYLFNPENDMALACGDSYYMAPASVRRMAAELSVLPAWYADEGSTVWVDSDFDCDYLKSLPLALPVEATAELLPIYNKVSPWGWNPALLRRLREAGFPADAFPSVESMERIRVLSGRQTAVGMLERLRAAFSDETVGEAHILHSMAEAERFIANHPDVLLKAPWSGSGRGVQPVRKELSASLRGWAEHIFVTQKALVGEPRYDKVMDFAMEFFVEGGKVDFAGYSLFETDARGSYKENVLASDGHIQSRLCAYVEADVLARIRECVQMQLAATIGVDYEGYAGVDMMICRVKDGTYRIHPCVEINLRMNMGVVARLFYDRYVCADRVGRYVIEYYREAGEGLHVHQEMCAMHSLKVEGGRISSGYLSLTPVWEGTCYQAYVLV